MVDHLHDHAARRAARGDVRAAQGAWRPRASSSASKSAELEAGSPARRSLEAEDPALLRTYRASLSDLGALRLHPDLSEGATLPAAGLPWFMALFGRDSLITSFQALPYLPGLAATTLRVLAAAPGRRLRDDFHEREPGQDPARAALRRAHRARRASLLALLRIRRRHAAVPRPARRVPPLVRRRRARPRARAATRAPRSHWIEDSGDVDGDGYVEYARRNPTTGLVNQCWKDSWDSIQFADGTLARGPIATCEIQGYVYDAQRRAARLAREVWGDARARRAPRAPGRRRCATRFRRDFWMPERGCHALALDGDKRQVDSLTSNIGHLLWSGLLDEAEAAATAERLLDEQLYSGWGVRTLGAREAGYNPLGYHTGTVWPHENSLIAAGLARYGHRDAAATIAARDARRGAALRAPPAGGLRRLSPSR